MASLAGAWHKPVASHVNPEINCHPMAAFPNALITEYMPWSFGLLEEPPVVKAGKIVQSNFDDYQMLKLKDTPEINVHLMESHEPPGGLGEAGTPLIGPAVANAVFAATGKRVRRLPIRPKDIV